ncbi:MAG: hypothetical protein H0X41_02140, partial [Chitinophagaceae bacterium]|nr:hypothetical protein [Chitinophagaceae bacterium]
MTLVRFLYTICLLVFSGRCAAQNSLHLEVAGNSDKGFIVNVYEGHQLRITRTEEFSLQLFNTDLSTTASINSWKADKWTGNDTSVTLSKISYIKEFDAALDVSVHYEIIARHIVKKTVRLFQPSMPGMYYIIRETDRPAADPVKYASFEHNNFPGGFIHEMFPAVGWVTADNQVVTFLTDAGYKNQYTRTTRRRFSGRGGGFVGMRKLPDPELFSVATAKEQAGHDHYIRQTYGEMYNLDAGKTIILNPGPGRKEGNTDISTDDSVTTLNCHGGDKAGIAFFSPLKDQHVYTISFLCKGSAPLALKLFRIKNSRQTVELEDGLKYIDAFPVQQNEWTLFKGSILVPYIENDSICLFIGTLSGKQSIIKIKELKIEEHIPQREPYNILELGRAMEKTSYAVIEPYKDHQQFMIAAQTNLAEAMGFGGSQIEKMLYANFNMLTWITSVNDTTPFNVPNMNYMPDMYNRDCFFAAVSTYNRDLNLSLWDQWAKTQTTKGAIGTIITPYMGSVEAKDNEASIEWLIWAMLNKRRFGVQLPQERIKRTVDYVLNEFDSAADGICRSHFPLCQIDIIDFNPKTDRLAVNQGMLVIALKVIKELGFNIGDVRIEKAERGYREFYDVKRKHLIYDKKYPDLISLNDLEPEFFSLWLFNKPLLTDEMVINHLDQIPVLNKTGNSPHPEFGTTAPILIHLTKYKKGYAYLSKNYQPF